jgi:hypothetical protein
LYTIRVTNLAGPRLVEVDYAQCQRLALTLQSFEIPEDREYLLAPVDRDKTGNFFLFVVAICHQTSPRGKPRLTGIVNGDRQYGWDYLVNKFAEETSRRPELLEPCRWRDFDADQMAELFEDPISGKTLTEPKRRAQLVRDLGFTMEALQLRSMDELFQRCQGQLQGGTPNLLQSLKSFAAYQDPVKKKSFFFLSIMQNSGIWVYPDVEHLGPPVDYHEVRGHLRLGTVRVNSPGIRHKLRYGIEVLPEEDIMLRESVYEAMMYITRQVGMVTPSQIHYVLWNLFRSYCTRTEPSCFAPVSLPAPYNHISKQFEGCPFQIICAGKESEPLLSEHVFSTEWY